MKLSENNRHLTLQYPDDVSNAFWAGLNWELAPGTLESVRCAVYQLGLFADQDECDNILSFGFDNLQLSKQWDTLRNARYKMAAVDKSGAEVPDSGHPRTDDDQLIYLRVLRIIISNGFDEYKLTKTYDSCNHSRIVIVTNKKSGNRFEFPEVDDREIFEMLCQVLYEREVMAHIDSLNEKANKFINNK